MRGWLATKLIMRVKGEQDTRETSWTNWHAAWKQRAVRRKALWEMIENPKHVHLKIKEAILSKRTIIRMKFLEPEKQDDIFHSWTVNKATVDGSYNSPFVSFSNVPWNTIIFLNCSPGLQETDNPNTAFVPGRWAHQGNGGISGCSLAGVGRWELSWSARAESRAARTATSPRTSPSPSNTAKECRDLCTWCALNAFENQYDYRFSRLLANKKKKNLILHYAYLHITHMFKYKYRQDRDKTQGRKQI